MSKDNAKEKLVEFLDRKAFDPVLNARPDRYPDNQKPKLEHVQRSTRSEKERFHHYGSAKEVVDMFKDDLNSEPAKKVHRELRDLGLPTLNDVRDEFEQLAEKLGVD